MLVLVGRLNQGLPVFCGLEEGGQDLDNLQLCQVDPIQDGCLFMGQGQQLMALFHSCLGCIDVKL